LVGLVNEVASSSSQKVVWQCLLNKEHEHWEATVGSVLAGSGCPECGGNAKLNEEKIKKRLKGRSIKIVEGTFESSSSNAKWNCLADKKHPLWTANVNSVLRGVGCPSCAEYGFKEVKSAYIYILILGDLHNPIGIKCGITNNEPKFRRSQIKRKTNELVTLAKQWHHQSGKLIREIEKEIITNFKHNDLQGLLGDGSSETFYYSDLELIVDHINKKIK
jgi:hypothetical protein